MNLDSLSLSFSFRRLFSLSLFPTLSSSVERRGPLCPPSSPLLVAARRRRRRALGGGGGRVEAAEPPSVAVEADARQRHDGGPGADLLPGAVGVAEAACRLFFDERYGRRRKDEER